MSATTSFNESDHPRADDGKFAAKDAPDSEASLESSGGADPFDEHEDMTEAFYDVLARRGAIGRTSDRESNRAAREAYEAEAAGFMDRLTATRRSQTDPAVFGPFDPAHLGDPLEELRRVPTVKGSRVPGGYDPRAIAQLLSAEVEAAAASHPGDVVDEYGYETSVWEASPMEDANGDQVLGFLYCDFNNAGPNSIDFDEHGRPILATWMVSPDKVDQVDLLATGEIVADDDVDDEVRWGDSIAGGMAGEPAYATFGPDGGVDTMTWLDSSTGEVSATLDRDGNVLSRTDVAACNVRDRLESASQWDSDFENDVSVSLCHLPGFAGAFDDNPAVRASWTPPEGANPKVVQYASWYAQEGYDGSTADRFQALEDAFGWRSDRTAQE